MRWDDLLEDLAYAAPLALVLLGGGLTLWLTRARFGRSATAAALTLLGLALLHAAIGFSQRLLMDAINARPPSDLRPLLLLGFSSSRVLKSVPVAVAVLVLAHAALARHDPSPKVPS